MKRFITLTVGVTLAAAWIVAGQSMDRADLGAIARLRDEGLTRSQVMDTLFWLTDRYGPRLNGSPEYEEAGTWAVDRLRSYGVVNVRKERLRAGPGWSLAGFHATMTSPRVMPLIGLPKAWSVGTKGTLSADVVRLTVTTPADLERYRGTLRGKAVLLQPARAVRMLEYGDGAVLRYQDQNGKWLNEALTSGPLPPPGIGGAPGSRDVTTSLLQMCRDEGVVALFDRGPDSDLSAGGSNLSWVQQRPDGGTVVLEERATGGPAADIPQVTLAVEHYNRMTRLLEHGVPVKVEVNIDARVTPETEANTFNVVGEIPGTDKADEIVLVGAHFDSWHGATGATDNASGSAAMMEVLRIIKASGLVPRRTIRIGLWAGEEVGFTGSRTYATEHLGTLANPKPELAKTVAYFNLDNGTGRIRGVWTQENAAARSVFAAWAAPLADLGVNILSPRRVMQTDHMSFDVLGVPAFQFVQERYEYNARTHHSNMDFYDRIQPDDMKQIATVAAIFAWRAATSPDPLPRRSSPASGAR